MVIVFSQFNYTKTRWLRAIFMPVIIEFSRYIGTYLSAKFELNKANSIEAIELMMNSGIEVLAVKGLHTKLYLFDEAGIIGSANFTAGGFKSNIELSLFFQDEVEILSDLHMYYDEMYNKIIQAGNGVITKEIISDAKERYFKAFDSKKNKGKNLNSYMFGVSLDKKTQFSDIDEIVKEIELCSTEADIVNDMFKISEKSEQIKCPTAHCGRCEKHFVVGAFTFPTVRFGR